MTDAFEAMSAIMALAWLAQRITGSCGWVDVCWTYGTGISGAVAALSGAASRKFVIIALLLLWSLRLGTAIALRTRGAPEDPRYHRLRADWGDHYESKMFWFLQLQALATWPLLIAVHFTARCAGPLAPHDILAILLGVFAIAGETLADSQLRRFRATHPRGGICNLGLWSWSRHPNYFFECLFWCSLPCFAWGRADIVALACLAPAGIACVLCFLTGIPPLERRMLETRGDAFRAYQARTSILIPWPPKRTSP